MQRMVWEGIARFWNKRRQKPWPDVVDFSKDRKFLLDLGCGSGRNFLKGKKYIGIDSSKEMLRLAKHNVKKKGSKVHLIRADLSNLPLKDNVLENVLLVASLHVLVGDKKRRKCLSEMKRVVKKDGHAFVTVWNKNQPRFASKKKVVFVPWKVGNKKYMRYYYLFTKNELKNLLAEYFEIEYIETKKIEKPFGENIIAVVKKL